MNKKKSHILNKALKKKSACFLRTHACKSDKALIGETICLYLIVKSRVSLEKKLRTLDARAHYNSELKKSFHAFELLVYIYFFFFFSFAQRLFFKKRAVLTHAARIFIPYQLAQQKPNIRCLWYNNATTYNIYYNDIEEKFCRYEIYFFAPGAGLCLTIKLKTKLHYWENIFFNSQK